MRAVNQNPQPMCYYVCLLQATDILRSALKSQPNYHTRLNCTCKHIKATGFIDILMKFIVGVVIINWRVRVVPYFEKLEVLTIMISGNVPTSCRDIIVLSFSFMFCVVPLEITM